MNEKSIGKALESGGPRQTKARKDDDRDQANLHRVSLMPSSRARKRTWSLSRGSNLGSNAIFATAVLGFHRYTASQLTRGIRAVSTMRKCGPSKFLP